MLDHLVQFHFLHPLWLLALIPLALIYWLLVHKKASRNEWNKVIDAHLLPVLLKVNSSKLGKSFSALLMLSWLISVLALANPVWEKRAVPVFQTSLARVIVLDLSRSMSIADIKPSRLARAKFKIEDILAKNEEGQTGLVVFAGDAFTVTPLTRDMDTISSLLSSLAPNIMPVQGSRADLGLLKAQELLQQAGIKQGQVLLIADGAKENPALEAAEELNKQGYVVSVLSLGTVQGGPIPNVVGQDRKPIVVPLQEKQLKQIAEKGGGRYSQLRSSNADIDYLLASSLKMDANKAERADDLNNQDWKSEGPLLVLLLLPLAALAFRRGWLLSVGLVVMVVGQPQPVMAASVWDNLWTRQDQQADQALQRGDFEQAQQLAKDPVRRGSAAFKKGDYEQALSDFSMDNSADSAYNKGNALAQLKQYEEAIKAYDEALEQQPAMHDAIDNKAKIEELLKQQQVQKKQQQKQDEQQKDQDQQSKQNQQQDSKSGQSDKQDSEQKQKKADDDKDDKNDKEQQSKENQFAKANEENQQEQNEDNENDKEQEQQKANAKQIEGNAAKDESEKDKSQAQVEAEALSKEEKIAAEQWLRRIPDNPGELLKRKFKYQYKQRRHSSGSANGVPW